MDITVYIINDHVLVREGLRFLLETQPDIEVVGEAANGRDAVQQVVKLCPAVVIIDMSMPELNAIEVTEQIRKLCPHTQAIILSMYSTTEHVLRAFKVGACGYLLKESAGVEIVSAVRSVHAGHRYLSQKMADRMIDDYIRQRETAGTRSAFSTGLARVTVPA